MAGQFWIPRRVDDSIRTTGSKRSRTVLVALALGLGGAAIYAGAAFWSRPEPIDEDEALAEPPAVAAESTATARATHTGPDAAAAEVVVVRTPRLDAKAAAERDAFDPRRDGWDTEAFVDRSDGFWKLVRDRIAHGDALDANPAESAFSPHLAVDFVGTALHPDALVEAFRDGPLTVQRLPVEAPGSPNDRRGSAGLDASVDDLAALFAACRDTHVHTKTTRVEAAATGVAATTIVEIAGRETNGVVQVKLTCRAEWLAADSDLPTLQSLRLVDYERAERRGAWFVDATAAALGNNPAYREQLLHGLNHWLGRIERTHGIDVYGRHGLAVGDVDGDDREDFYLCQPGGLPNRLFVQNADGTFRDASQAAGVDWLDRTASALFVDLDNDADQDLVIATESGLLVMANDAAGRFELRSTLRPADRDVQSLSAVDYDGDGLLDIYVCTDFANPVQANDAPPPRFVYHDANDGGANVLYRNQIAADRWSFSDVTKSVGLDADNRRHSLSAAWEDYDNDGDQDLYVANDYGQNCLYRNDGGKFTNVAASAGVTDFGSGMSVAWGDVNRDGFFDLYVGNMFSSAGNRVTRQAGFRAGADEATRSIYQRFAKGNSLFLGSASGAFAEASSAAGVEVARWAWSSVLADLNNDGRDDIFVANGYITGDNPDDL